MALHKIVNGKKIDLTPKEEAEVRAEWASNQQKEEAQRLELEEKKAQREILKQKVKDSLTLSEEDFKLLFEKRF